MEKTSPINNESPNVGEGSDNVRGSPEEEYILKWTDHKVNFFSLAAADLFNDEDLTDVTICCGEKLFDAHKLILSVCSPYFKSMLTHKKKLNKYAMSSSSSSNEPSSNSSMNCNHHLNQMHPIIFLKDVSPKDFERLLQFMYYGEVRVPNDDLESLILTAKSLKVKGLSASSLPSSLSQPIITNNNSNKEEMDENQIEDLSTKSNPKSLSSIKHKELSSMKHNNHTPPKKRRISASALHAINNSNNHPDENDKEHGDENVEHPPSLKSSSTNYNHSHHPLSSTHHELQQHQRTTHFLSTSAERFLQTRDHPHHHKLRSSISAAAFINELANDRILQRRVSPTLLNSSTVNSTSPSTTRPMTANSFVSSVRRQPLTPPPNNGGNVGLCRSNPLDRRERLTHIRHSSGHQICSSTPRLSSKNSSDSKHPPSSGKIPTPI